MCTLLDASFRAFASVGTRSAGNAQQEIVLSAPGDGRTIEHGRPHIACPTDVVMFLVHCVTYGREQDAVRHLPFALEDENGAQLLDLSGGVENYDAAGSLENMEMQAYFVRAASLLHENAGSDRVSSLEEIDVAKVNEIDRAVRNSRAAIEAADRSSPLTKGWSMLYRRSSREALPEDRGAAVHGGYFSAMPHDVLEIATRCDTSANALDGSHSYIMHFERWNEPPSNASWFLHVMPAAANYVSLTRTEPGMNIALSPTAPGEIRNWIPTQPGPLEVRLILCWPSERALSEMWTPPEIVQTSE